MYAISLSLEVNPPGAAPLTRDQVWRGLVMKAENAVPFVPGMSSCVVVKREPHGLVRDVVYEGRALRERIRFTPPVEVLFERDGSEDWITNVLSELDGRLILTFTFAVAFDGAAPGSAEEAAQGDRMRGAYIAALEGTLRTVRAMVADGTLG